MPERATEMTFKILFLIMGIVVVSWFWQRYWPTLQEAIGSWVGDNQRGRNLSTRRIWVATWHWGITSQCWRKAIRRWWIATRRWWCASLGIVFVACFIFFLLPVGFARWVGGLSGHTITSWGDGLQAAFVLAVAQVIWIIPLFLIYLFRRKTVGADNSTKIRENLEREKQSALTAADKRLETLRTTRSDKRLSRYTPDMGWDAIEDGLVEERAKIEQRYDALIATYTPTP